MMRRTWISALVLLTTCALALRVGAQTPKGKGAEGPGASYRTLTGVVTKVEQGGRLVEVGIVTDRTTSKAGGESTWNLLLGNQTLVLRAGKDGRFSEAELSSLAKGETVRAVASLKAEGTDRAHVAWWLVVYPQGTNPPER